MDLNLTGKNALVGGASRGIGRAIAVELALLGASVTLVARSRELLLDVMGSLDRSSGQQHDLIEADYNYPDELKTKVAEYLRRSGRIIHILVNNTGGPPGGPALYAKPEEYVSAFTKHLICNQLLAQLTVEGMKKSGYGRIINIISTSVKAPIRGLGVSNTVRGAVASWAKTLSFELGEYGITVNNILPGFTMTERLDEIIQDSVRKTGLHRDIVIENMQKQVPLQRFAKPDEIAAAAAFLASPAAAYINGINLPVDGGRLESL
ncbi:MAG: short-chain dehydrogenase [Chitinophagales bacterium]|nr:MAG: short-chain dehydrogenase [Chitinophagales bacterium]